MDIASILERVGSIKLKGGVFGKMTLTIMFVSLVLAMLAVATGNVFVQCAMGLIIAGFASYFLHRLMTFTENNPHAAIMDGAEFLMRERIIHETKHGGLLTEDPPTIHHEQPLIEAPDTPDVAFVEHIKGAGGE